MFTTQSRTLAPHKECLASSALKAGAIQTGHLRVELLQNTTALQGSPAGGLHVEEVVWWIGLFGLLTKSLEIGWVLDLGCRLRQRWSKMFRVAWLEDRKRDLVVCAVAFEASDSEFIQSRKDTPDILVS